MKPTFWKSIIIVAGVCVGAFAAYAAPLKRADVAADPVWLLHLDFDGFRPTTIGQYILAEMDKPEAKARLAVFQSMFSVDLRTQLHGATLYGTTAKPEDGVLIIYADFDADRLITFAKAMQDHQTIEHNKHVIHNWLNDGKKNKEGEPSRVYATIQGRRVIFGQRESAVTKALDVLDGTTSSLTIGNAFSGVGLPGNPNFIEGAARKMDLRDSDPKASILKFSKNVELALGEKDKQFQGRLTLEADNEEVAGHLLSIAQGVLALMKFDNSKPETVKFANSLNISQDGAHVVGSITLPASQVVEMMKEGAEQKAKEKKETKE
jgi:hypothetical protein